MPEVPQIFEPLVTVHVGQLLDTRGSIIAPCGQPLSTKYAITAARFSAERVREDFALRTTRVPRAMGRAILFTRLQAPSRNRELDLTYSARDG